MRFISIFLTYRETDSFRVDAFRHKFSWKKKKHFEMNKKEILGEILKPLALILRTFLS
jgi:hypothetical protein